MDDTCEKTEAQAIPSLMPEPKDLKPELLYGFAIRGREAGECPPGPCPPSSGEGGEHRETEAVPGEEERAKKREQMYECPDCEAVFTVATYRTPKSVPCLVWPLHCPFCMGLRVGKRGTRETNARRVCQVRRTK